MCLKVMNMTGIIYLFGAGLGFFLSACLFLKKGRSGRIFASLVTLISYEIFVEYIFITSGWQSHWVFFFVKEALGFLYGPILFFYVRSITGAVNGFRARYLLHLVPFVVYLLIDVNTITPLFIDPAHLLQGIDDRGVNRYRIIVRYVRIGIIFFYLAASFTVIRAYRKRIGDFFSNHVRIGLAWLNVFIYGAGLIWIAAISSSFIFIHYPEYWWMSARSFFFLTITAIYATGIFALTQSETYALIHRMDGSDKGDDKPARYAKSVIPPEQMAGYRNRITACLVDDKIYLDPDLTLAQLSDRTGLSAHTLSQVINATMGINFFTLVNRYRIEYAAELLASEKDASVISVCFRAGFNSKSAFNAIFKQHTGLTPSAYRSRISAQGTAVPDDSAARG
ncbi:MAG TPA: helix-turn-helix domain-containing protein [Spirochaetota bacterium]|nr:helix-turn-helix domain-containing protein [Spirochaetota bacterium]